MKNGKDVIDLIIESNKTNDKIHKAKKNQISIGSQLTISEKKATIQDSSQLWNNYKYKPIPKGLASNLKKEKEKITPKKSFNSLELSNKSKIIPTKSQLSINIRDKKIETTKSLYNKDRIGKAMMKFSEEDKLSKLPKLYSFMFNGKNVYSSKFSEDTYLDEIRETLVDELGERVKSNFYFMINNSILKKEVESEKTLKDFFMAKSSLVKVSNENVIYLMSNEKKSTLNISNSSASFVNIGESIIRASIPKIEKFSAVAAKPSFDLAKLLQPKKEKIGSEKSLLKFEVNTSFSFIFKKLEVKNIRLLAKGVGSGASCKVNKLRYLSLIVAQKEIHPVLYNDFNFKKELMLNFKFKNTYLPTFVSIGTSSNKSNMMMEYVSGITLEDHLCRKKTTFFEEDILESTLLMIELAKSIEFLHRFKLIHRDVKPSNVLITKAFDLKLIDLGISKVLNVSKSSTITEKKGTILYEAPENYCDDLVARSSAASRVKKFEEEMLGLINKRSKQSISSISTKSSDLSSQANKSNNKIQDNQSSKQMSSISTKYDVWSFGLILSYIFSRKRPWEGLDVNKIVQKLVRKEEFQIPKEINPNFYLAELIKSCTKINPKERISLSEARISLEKFLVKQLLAMNFSTAYFDRVEQSGPLKGYLFALKTKSILQKMNNNILII